jgi:Flp pilus assembly protein TadG
MASDARRNDPRDEQRIMKHAQRGASMVEFAIAATALLFLLFGIIEFGRALYIYHTVSNAARLASRWAEVRGAGCFSPLDHCDATQAEIQNYVQSNVPILDSGTLQVTAQWSTSTDPNNDCSTGSPLGNNLQGHLVCVTVAYPFRFALPIISSIPLNLASTSKMVIAN